MQTLRVETLQEPTQGGLDETLEFLIFIPRKNDEERIWIHSIYGWNRATPYQRSERDLFDEVRSTYECFYWI